MTVKSLSETQKDYIVSTFLNQVHSINDLATMYKRHRRTIIRALEERGVDPGVKHRTPKPRAVIPQPNMVIRTRTPWYRRLFQTLTLGLVG